MEEKEIEELLSESAENIPQREFSTRWAEIQDRLPNSRHRIRSRIISAIALSACVLLIATIMPFLFRSEPEKTFFDEDALIFSTTNQEDFYFQLQKAELKIIDFSNFDINGYKLATTEENNVEGGEIVFLNEGGEEEFTFSITFYSSFVKLNGDLYDNLKETTTVNGATVQYSTNFDELYFSKALTIFNNVTYLVEYTSLNNDLDVFLTNLFQ